MIAIQEGSAESRAQDRMEAETRKKVKGVLHCDMHAPDALPKGPAPFDILTTFFCVEYACLQP